jgi:hypothetical protein
LWLVRASSAAAYFVEQRKVPEGLDSRVCVSLAQAKESNSPKCEKEGNLNEIHAAHRKLVRLTDSNKAMD